MGNTKDYLDYLNNEVGIAPAASQEELDLAQSLADTYAKHGLDPEVQEFPAQSLGYLPYGALMVLMFLGMVLVGVGLTLTTLLGLLFVAASVALLAMTYTGQDVISGFGPRAHSQNVVAVRRADEGNERNRPIVILAHYDTPRVDPLTNPQFIQLKKYLALIVPNAVIAVAVCTVVQLLGFLPEPARRTFWVIGIIAALPELIWGVALIARKFSAYADGAVGNKSSVAALLSVMDRVCAGDAAHERKAPVASEDTETPVVNSVVRPATRKVTHTEVEQVEGKRHGEAVLRELGILPEDCQITYIEPEVHTYETEEPIEYDDEPVRAAGDTQATVDMPSTSEDPDSTRPMEAIQEPRLDAADSVLDAKSLSQLEDGQSTDEGPLQETDHSGLNTMVEEDAETAASAPRAERAVPAAMDDPDWGKSSYTPTNRASSANVARRAALFDLPDVSETSDGLSVKEDETPNVSYGMNITTASSVPASNTPSPMAQHLAEASAGMAAAPTPVRLDDADYVSGNYGTAPVQDQIEYLEAPTEASEEAAQTKRRGLSKLLGRKHWKGGAARSVELRGNVASALGNLPEITDEDPADIPWSALKNPTVVMSAMPEAQGASGQAADTQVVAPVAEPVGQAAMAEPASDASLAPEAAVYTEPQVSPYLENDEDGLFVEVGADGEPVVPTQDASDAEVLDGGEELPEEIVEPEEPTIDRELRDAILAMSDEELKKHDVWFVLTGASELNHAGVREFVASHRKDLRGAFIINLESVGAGELTVLTDEGLGRSRRCDKRLLRLLNSVASDMHMELPQLSHSWADTEATPCMRRSLRAVTVMGMGAGEVPAFSATAADSPDEVNEEQVVDTVALITEAIRRS